MREILKAVRQSITRAVDKVLKKVAAKFKGKGKKGKGDKKELSFLADSMTITLPSKASKWRSNDAQPNSMGSDYAHYGAALHVDAGDAIHRIGAGP